MTSRARLVLTSTVVLALVAACGTLPATPPPTITPSPHPTVSPSGSRTPEPTAQPTTALTTEGLGIVDFERVLATAPGVELHDIEAGGPGFVAVGGTAGGSAVVYTSTDAVNWQPVPEMPSFSGAHLLGVVQVGPGLVAFGESVSLSDLPTPPSPQPRLSGMPLFTSTDGLDWQRVPFGPAFPSDVWSIDVVVGPRGLVAFGNRPTVPGTWVWASPDGGTWTAAAIESGTAHVSTAIPTARGWVAIGSVNDHAAAWTSSDGGRWILAGIPAQPKGSTLMHLVAGGPGLIAVGRAPLPSGATGVLMLTSADGGATWTADPDTPTTADPDTGIRYEFDHIACRPGRCIADGGLALGAGDGWAGASLYRAFWSSADGLHWRTYPELDYRGPAPSLDELADTGTLFVASGVTSGGNAGIWTSPDGVAWHELALPQAQLDAIRQSSLVSTAGRVFALGFVGSSAAIWLGVPAAP